MTDLDGYWKPRGRPRRPEPVIGRVTIGLTAALARRLEAYRSKGYYRTLSDAARAIIEAKLEETV